MEIKPIRTEIDYKESLKRLESIFDADINTKEGEELEILSILIEKYEKENEINVDLKHGQKGKTESEFNFDYIYELVKNVSSEEKGTIVEKCLKLNEEVGELSAEILKMVEYKHTSETKDQIIKNTLIESVDSLIMIFDIMVKLGFSKSEIVDTAETQINKWLSYIK